MLRDGDQVILNTPENARLHGARGTVLALTVWGAHVATLAAATGRYRAGHAEMVPLGGTNGRAASGSPTGEVCDNCGGCSMRRTGACLMCEDCGTSGGCG